MMIVPKRPGLIIWDWDNTLVNSRPIVVAALNDIVKKANLPPITDQDVLDVMGTHMGRYWQENFGENKEEAVAYYLSRYVVHDDKLILFPETKEALAWVQNQGIPQMVVSNKNQLILNEECDRLGLRSYFNRVVGTDERHIAKPSKAFADEIFGSDWPTNLVMIGDGESDMEFAALLGAYSIFIRPGDNALPFSYNRRFPDLKGVYSFLKQQKWGK